MYAARLSGGLLGPVEQLYDALVDPVRRERACVWTLTGYVAVWSLYAVIAKSSQDIHFDMGEMVALSREYLLGTPKHPPLGSWLVGVWFSVFPSADWAYYLFAVIVAAVGLWFSWKICERYLDADKRVIGLALLTLTPFFNFHALKYNANTILIPLWAATTWCFLRSFETRSTGFAALAGLWAAGAMLGKYWSIFLLAGLAIAALADPRRREYFRSPAPWVTIAVGCVVLAPHAVWLVANDFPPLHYGLISHAVESYWKAALLAFTYVPIVVSYLAVPIVLTIVAARPSMAAVADTLWPRDPYRRTVVIAFALPILLPTVVAVASKSVAVAMWTMSAMALAPVILLSSKKIAISRAAGTWILASALVFPLFMLAASPIIAAVIHSRGVPHHASHYQLLAANIENAWRQTSDEPLKLVGSSTDLGNGLAFYLTSKPSIYDAVQPSETPWITPERIEDEGIALACNQADWRCTGAMGAFLKRFPAARQTEVELSRIHFGIADPPERYRIVTIPPRQQQPAQ